MGKLTCRNDYKALGRKPLWGILISVFVFCIGSIYFFSGFQPDDDNSYKHDFRKNYSVYAVDIPKNLSFAGERVPLEKFYVHEALDRELLINTYFHSQSFLFLKKSTRYLPIVEPILKEEGIPADFKYLPFIESGFSNAKSPAGAEGYWQFLKSTAREYGLEVNSEIDERYHIEKSTRAACKFLKDSYEKYNSWTLAAASYNVGRRRLSSEMDRQKADDYYSLLLNEETGRYVYRILAVKLLLTNPEEYGFKFRKKDLYDEIHVVTLRVDTPVTHFADFAREYDLSYKELKEFNPWLRNHYLSNKSKKTYYIKIPKN